MNESVKPLSRSAVSVREFCELCCIGRTSFYEAVKRRQIRPVKFGRRTLVPATEIDTFLRGLPSGARR